MIELIITGRLTADPVRKATSAGKELAEFTIACDRGFGENKETTFFRCTAWEKRAIPILQYVHKGDKVLVRGEVSAHGYLSNGEPKASLDVRVDICEFLELRRTETEPKAEQKPEPRQDFKPVMVEDLPF